MQIQLNTDRNIDGHEALAAQMTGIVDGTLGGAGRGQYYRGRRGHRNRGGSVGATLGAFAILQRGDQEIEHPRNLLREVRQGRGAGDQIMPESVWRLLVIEEERDLTRRQQLLDHWDLELERVRAQTGEEGMRLPFSRSVMAVSTVSMIYGRALPCCEP